MLKHCIIFLQLLQSVILFSSRLLRSLCLTFRVLYFLLYLWDLPHTFGFSRSSLLELNVFFFEFPTQLSEFCILQFQLLLDFLLFSTLMLKVFDLLIFIAVFFLKLFILCGKITNFFIVLLFFSLKVCLFFFYRFFEFSRLLLLLSFK